MLFIINQGLITHE